MMFWRRKTNGSDQEREKQENALLHPPGAPELEPSLETDEPRIGDDVLHHELNEPESEIIDELDEAPVPQTSIIEAATLRESAEKAEEGGWVSRLVGGLTRSSSRLGQGITDILTKRRLDTEVLEQLEELLITADLGPKTAARLVQELSKSRFGSDITDQEVREVLAAGIEAILAPVAKPLPIPADAAKGPFTVLVCGVNGVGKTTTIGKLAHQIHVRQHRPVMLAAGDTFRAAAVEQLKIWGERAHCPVMARDIGADAASVAYDAYDEARKAGTHVLFIDTAGRLHNKTNLMAELQKVVRVLAKHDDSLPHEVLLVLDATTGQNAHAQVEIFREMVQVTGLIVTKLDGSARGGVVVSLADRFGIPIYAVGVGESAEDLQPFDAKAFSRSLVGLPV